MNIYQIYELCNYILNKDQFGRVFQPEKFNLVIEAVEIDLFKQRYGLPQHYQPGMPLPQMAYEITQKISDDMSPFKKWLGQPGGLPVMTINANGLADLPKDYVHVSSVRTPEDRVVEVLFNHEFNERLDNPNRTPSFDNPVCTIYNKVIDFRPKDLKHVHFIYLAFPKPASLVVTYDNETDVITYDSVNSVQTQFPVDMHTEYVRRVLRYAGLNISNEMIIQYSHANES